MNRQSPTAQCLAPRLCSLGQPAVKSSGHSGTLDSCRVGVQADTPLLEGCCSGVAPGPWGPSLSPLSQGFSLGPAWGCGVKSMAGVGGGATLTLPPDTLFL